jgi:hypothetical protein
MSKSLFGCLPGADTCIFIHKGHKNVVLDAFKHLADPIAHGLVDIEPDRGGYDPLASKKGRMKDESLL